MKKKKLNLDEELKKCKTMDDLTGQGGLMQRLLGGMIEKILDGEIEDHLGYAKHSPSGYKSGNSRNGKSHKKLKSSFGPLEVSIPRDRNSSFDPQLVQKRQTDISSFDEKIILMYAKGMSVSDIQDHIQSIYGASISPTTISSITDKILETAYDWQQRSLDSVWVIIYFDAVHFKVREEGVVMTKAVYTAYGISIDGYREVLGLWIGDSEGASFWAGVFADLKDRGVDDILIACMDGLKGLPEALHTVFPKALVQLCVIHMIRTSLTRVPNKHYKEFVSDLKLIYKARSKDLAEMKLEDLRNKWEKKYPHAVSPWLRNWGYLSTFYSYPEDLRKIMYTSNAVEGLHRRLRKVTKAKSVFPSNQSLFKILFLAVRDITKKGPVRVQNWKYIYSALVLHFPNRIEEVL